MEIDFNNINTTDLFNLIETSKRRKIKIEYENDNFYRFSSDSRNFDIQNYVIVPDKLECEDYNIYLYDTITTNITDEIYYNTDNFIQEWIDDENITKISFKILTRLNTHDNEQCDHQIRMFKKFKSFCIQKQEILGYVSCIFDFYKDNTSNSLSINREQIQFLKKIKMFDYKLNDIIKKFKSNKKSIIFETKNSNDGSVKFYFNKQLIFRTFNLKFFNDHNGLQIITFISQS